MNHNNLVTELLLILVCINLCASTFDSKKVHLIMIIYGAFNFIAE